MNLYDVILPHFDLFVTQRITNPPPFFPLLSLMTTTRKETNYIGPLPLSVSSLVHTDFSLPCSSFFPFFINLNTFFCPLSSSSLFFFC